MERLFLATNPGCVQVIREAWWSVEPEEEFESEMKLLGFNSEAGRFEPAVPGRDYRVFIVNDKVEAPLDGYAVGGEDYLIYHERTTGEAIRSLFLPARKKASSHDRDTSKSDYARVLTALPALTPESLPGLLEEVFASSRREVTLFLCHLDEWPPLPEALSFLKEKYEVLRENPSREGMMAFIRECTEING